MNDYERRLISSLEAEEERLAFTRFDNVDAGWLGSAMVVVRDRAVASGHDRYPAAGEIPETSAVLLLCSAADYVQWTLGGASFASREQDRVLTD
jgi:uncharacterized protein (UPF0303 family)